MRNFLCILALTFTTSFALAFSHTPLQSLGDAEHNNLAESFNKLISQNPEVGNCPPFFFKVQTNDLKPDDSLPTSLHAFLSEQVGLDEEFDFAYLKPLESTEESFKTTLYSLSEKASEAQRAAYDSLAKESSSLMANKAWTYMGGFAHYFSIKNKTSNLIKIRLILDNQSLQFFVVGNGHCRKIE